MGFDNKLLNACVHTYVDMLLYNTEGANSEDCEGLGSYFRVVREDVLTKQPLTLILYSIASLNVEK